MLSALVVGIAAPARAGDDPPLPVPRTAVTIGGASVVLIAADNRLYAFVDRVEDNAPVKDAELEIQTDDGTAITMKRASLTMTKATDGLFYGPLLRAGRMQDAFMVSLRSADGTGEAPAEITYTDVRPAAAEVPASGLSARLAVAVVSGCIGILAAAALLYRKPGRDRRRAARRDGTAHPA